MKGDENTAKKSWNFTPSKIHFWLIALSAFFLPSALSIAASTSAHAAEVTLAWDPNADPDIGGYNLYFGSSSRNYPNRIDVGNVTSSTIQSLEEGQMYFFAVTAYDTGRNESLFSEEISYTIPIIAKVFTISASAGVNGHVSPSGEVSVDSQSDQNFTIAADSGHQISDVLVNGESVGAVSSYTFYNVRSDQTVHVAFVSLAENEPPVALAGLYPENTATAVSVTPLLEIEGFSDPDSSDEHGATQWQIATDASFNQPVFDHISSASNTNGCLVNVPVPPGVLFPDRNYYWRFRVRDDRESGMLWSGWSDATNFSTDNLAFTDNNGNGVADDIEPDFSDLDADGQNDNDQSLMRVFASEADDEPIGIKAVDGVQRLNYYNHLEIETIQDKPSPVALQYGLLNFNLSVDRIGGTAVVEIYLSGEVSEHAQAYKYDTVNGWYAFPVQFKNGTYVIEITDGGLGDVDGIANGIVVDPIGLSVTNAVSANIKSDGASGGGGGCFIGAAGTGITESWLRNLFSFLFNPN